MTDLIRLLGVISRMHPEALDAIFPHQAIGARGSVFRAVSKGSESELNPQPLPPGDKLVLASAALGQDIASAAISAHAAGIDTASRIVATAVEDWCGTPHPPLPIPWPAWPFPWPPDPEPHPEWDIGASRVAGALSLGAVASRLADGEVRDALSKGAEQLLEVGLAT
jgi:hypothetical protein